MGNSGVIMSISTAEQLEESEQYEKAYEEYKRLYEKKPNSVDLLQHLGHVALILNKNDEAIEYYSRILGIDPSNVMAYQELMDLYENTDRYKYYVARGNMHIVTDQMSYAISDFKKALTKATEDDEQASTRFVLADLYEKNGKHPQAIDEYLRILDSDSANEEVYINLARIYVKEDALSSAVSILERAVEHGFETENVKENLAQLYIKCDMPEKAYETTENELVKVKCLLQESKNNEAKTLLDSVAEKYKNDADFNSLIAQYYFNSKEFEKSLEAVNEYDRLQKNSPLVFQMRALIYEEMGRDFEAHINWAKYNILRGDRAVALNEYMMAVQEKDDDADLLRNLGELFEEEGNKYQAAEYWEKLAAVDPSNKIALEKMANFKESIGDYRDELGYLEKLYEITPKSIKVVENLAKCYEKNRNRDKSLELYKKYLSLSPVNDEYQKIKAKINKLEKTETIEEDEGLLDKIMRWLGNR
jgi:tetratricopeptide (TPR) repeat protein